jgi:hypothetical protein
MASIETFSYETEFDRQYHTFGSTDTMCGGGHFSSSEVY